MEGEAVPRRQRELESLYGLARELLQGGEYDQILDAILRHTVEALRAERGFLVLLRGESFDFKVVRGWRRDELESARDTVSRSILQEALRAEGALLVEDALSDPRFGKKQSVARLQLRSVLAAPLRLESKVVGALYVEIRAAAAFGEPERVLFSEILSLSAQALTASLKRLVLEERNSALERDLLARYSFPGVITKDAAFLRVLESVARVAKSGLPVLVQGQSGTGKELIARALHLNSARPRGPFVTINCGALSPALLESELFGHVKGAFTGAQSHKEGLLTVADQGTLFLDELAELPKELQAKLLRALQFGEVLPVGATRPQIVDVRFVAATHRDLEDEVRQGRFREDLFYRLNAAILQLPALKDRPGDILLLFHHFLREAATKEGRPIPRVTPTLERALEGYAWPGNVRELENEAKRLLAMTPPDEPLTVDRLSARITSRTAEAPILTRLVEQEKELIELHLRLAQGNRTHAAKSLGITREGLRQKMKRYGLA